MAEEPQVKIEEIMKEIRAQIVAKNDAQTAGQGGAGVAVNLTGKRLPADFYEHLYLARLSYNQLNIKRHVTRSTVPLIGPLLDKLRGALHELVLFYVNQLAAKQIAMNTHLLQALSLLSEEIEAGLLDAAEDDHE